MAKNRYLTGSTGDVWINGRLFTNIKSIEAKVTGNFEDMTTVGSYATEQVYLGWSGEGSMTTGKCDSSVLETVGDAFKTGIMPDIKIITRLTDKQTGKSERVAISGVTISEYMLAKFETQSQIEEEVPFKFADYEILETI